MKRTVSALGALLLIAAFSTGARAQIPVPQVVNTPLKFTTHKLTAGTGEVLVDGVSAGTACSACAVDSFQARRVGTQIAVLCTTSVVDTRKWIRPYQFSAPAVVDTIAPYCVLNVYDETGSATETAMDSLGAAAQASFDGVTWFTCYTPYGVEPTPSAIVSRLNHLNVTGAFLNVISLNGASLARGAPVWAFEYKERILASAIVPNIGHLAKYPLLRWIIAFPDGGGYKVKASVSHLEYLN